MSNLTDADVKDARPGEKPKKLMDGGGLFLMVTPKGGKWWRFRYRFEGKEKLISLGIFPKVSLSEARALRDNARQILKEGIDPSAVRKAEKDEREAAESVGMPSVRFVMDGSIELWKGRSVMRLSPDEARFVAKQLSVLVR